MNGNENISISYDVTSICFYNADITSFRKYRYFVSLNSVAFSLSLGADVMLYSSCILLLHVYAIQGRKTWVLGIKIVLNLLDPLLK